MATDLFDEATQLAIQTSLKNFQFKSLALPVTFSEKSSFATQEVLSSPPIVPLDAKPGPECPEYDYTPAVYELGGHIQGQDEALIAVVGATGTGKTTFINLVAGTEIGKVGRGLYSSTREVSSYSISYGGKNFTLIDTPGFDDCHRSDANVLVEIGNWLAQSYWYKRKLNAILYLTRISDPRMQGSPLGNLRMFKELCGEECYRNIVLGTTFWEVMDSRHPGSAEHREKELVEEFWADMIERGSEVIRIPETRWLARELLVRLARKIEMTLKNQQENVYPNMTLEDTTANFAFDDEAERLKAKHEEEIRQMERDREERQKKLKSDEEARTAELNKLLEEQRNERRRREEDCLREVKKSEQLSDEAKKEYERKEKEKAELVEHVQKMAKEKEIRERKRKRIEFGKEKRSGLDRMRMAQATKNILAPIREPHQAYTLCCDNCFRNIGASVYYQCNDALCKTGDDANFVLCNECHATPEVYCNEKSHRSSMKKLEQTDTHGRCKRVMDPPKPRVLRPCDRCGKILGAVYFHCCACLNDNCDICLRCVTTLQVCK